MTDHPPDNELDHRAEADDSDHSAVEVLASLMPQVPALRGMSHLVAFFLAVVGGVWLVVQAALPLQAVAAAVYATGLSLALGASAAYHRGPWGPATRRLMRKVDHSMIFVFVACTYTPILLLSFDGTLRIATLVAIWATAALGIVLRLLVHDPSRMVLVGAYVALGWMALILLPAVHGHVPDRTFQLLVIGGALYSVGACVYMVQRPDPLPRVFGFHEVFHVFVLAAAACHYGALYGLVSGRLPTLGSA